jgi:hypothetical protein
MKLARWLVLFHVLGLAVACAVAIKTDREAPKLMALSLFMLITGWATMLSAFAFLMIALIKRRGLREIVMTLVLILIGLYEQNGGTSSVTYLQSLPG